MDTLVPVVEVVLGGKTLSSLKGLNRFLHSAHVSLSRDKTRPSRSNGGVGENLRSTAGITLVNLDGQLWDAPRMREDMVIRIGYLGSSKYTRGGFIVTKPAFVLPGSGAITIQLSAEDYGADMVHDTRSRNLIGRTLGDAVAEVARSHSMESRVDPEIANVIIGNRGVKRPGTLSDWKFLEHMVHESGAHVMRVEAGTEPGARATLIVEQLLHRPLRKAGSDTVFSIGYRTAADYPAVSVSLDMRGVEPDALAGGTVGDTGAQSKLFSIRTGSTTDPVIIAQREDTPGVASADGESEEEAPLVESSVVAIPKGVFSLREFAKSVALWGEFKIRLSVSLSPGLPFLFPGHIIDLRGVGPFSGKVVVMSVEDDFGPGGYSQTLACASPLEGSVLSGSEDVGSGASRSLYSMPNPYTPGGKVVIAQTPDNPVTTEAEAE